MKRILFIAAATAAAILAFMFLSNMNHSDTHEEDGHEEAVDFDNIVLTQAQVSAAGLRMDAARERTMNSTIQASGTLVLRAQHQASVSALMGGVVKSVLVAEGQHVKKGQVVAMIENTEVVAMQRDYFSALRECSTAHAEMLRQQALQQKGAGVKKTMQQAESNWQVAAAAVTGLAQQLRQMGISLKAAQQGRFATVFPLRSPIGGTVSRITATLGSYADMQTPLMQIRDNAAVEADLSVFEKDLAKVKPGCRVDMTLTNQPGSHVEGRVYGVNQYFNDGTKAASAHVKITRAGGERLFEGMAVQGLIATGSQTCYALPGAAIVSAEGKNYIFMLNKEPRGGRYSFSRHEVTTGVEQDGYTEVSLCKHAKGGRKIVVDKAFYLASMTSEHGEHNH